MKIMQFMPEFGLAGAEIMCENLLIALQKLGHEVIAVSLYDYHSAITERIEDNGIRIIYLNKKTGIDISIYKKIFNILRQEKPDVVHTHRYLMEYVIPIAKVVGIKKLVHTVHSIATKEQSLRRRRLSAFFYKRCRVIPVALSNEIKKTIVQEYKLRENNIPVIFNGENLDHFQEKNDYSIADEFRVYHVGRFQPVKNQETIVKAIKELRCEGIPVVGILIGDNKNDYGEKIRSQISELGANKYILLPGTTSNISQELRKADIFILPSLFEGMPMTLIEAMASGLPIIASKVGGIPDMLKNGESAILINNPDEELAASIKLLYEKRDLREIIGRNARKNSVLFSSDTMAKAYVDVYSK